MSDTTHIPTGPAEFPTAASPQPHPASTTILAEEHQFRGIRIVDPKGHDDIWIPAAAYSFDGFRDWVLSEEFPARGQFTFSPEGLIIDMSPESLETHNYIKSDVIAALIPLVRKRELGRVMGDGVLFSNKTANISTEPDGLFISGESVRSGRCSLVASSRPGISIEIVGAPDWVLEVVSPTSIRKDKVILRSGYLKAGVGEYWIIDALGEHLDFQMLVSGGDGYCPVEACEGWLKSPTFGCLFKLSTNVDKNGFSHYLLDVKEES